MQANAIKLIECPRDAMQGWKEFIPTEKKIAYLGKLIDVGFDTIDAASFVSPKAIPQMADSAEVIEALEQKGSSSSILTIVANERGAEQACGFSAVRYLGFPFSVSETFQQKNTNAGIEESLTRVENIQKLCLASGKMLVVYISMGFGNPYGDPYNEEIVFEWVNKLVGLDIGVISLADTVGIATPGQVFDMTSHLVELLPGTEIGVHLHSTPNNLEEKLEAAVKAGCRRFDGAINGIGGCPMAGNELVGNMDTQRMINYFEEKGMHTGINREALDKATAMATEIFSTHTN
jgi:hydroxymethylglutaryl-CoA lyase